MKRQSILSLIDKKSVTLIIVSIIIVLLTLKCIFITIPLATEETRDATVKVANAYLESNSLSSIPEDYKLSYDYSTTSITDKKTNGTLTISSNGLLDWKSNIAGQWYARIILTILFSCFLILISSILIEFFFKFFKKCYHKYKELERRELEKEMKSDIPIDEATLKIYESAYRYGVEKGREDAFKHGRKYGYKQGLKDAYDEGYLRGKEDGSDEVISSIHDFYNE